MPSPFFTIIINYSRKNTIKNHRSDYVAATDTQSEYIHWCTIRFV